MRRDVLRRQQTFKEIRCWTNEAFAFEESLTFKHVVAIELYLIAISYVIVKFDNYFLSHPLDLVQEVVTFSRSYFNDISQLCASYFERSLWQPCRFESKIRKIRDRKSFMAYIVRVKERVFVLSPTTFRSARPTSFFLRKSGKDYLCYSQLEVNFQREYRKS